MLYDRQTSFRKVKSAVVLSNISWMSEILSRDFVKIWHMYSCLLLIQPRFIQLFAEFERTGKFQRETVNFYGSKTRFAKCEISQSTVTSARSCTQRLPKSWKHKKFSRQHECFLTREAVLFLSFSGRRSLHPWNHLFPLVLCQVVQRQCFNVSALFTSCWSSHASRARNKETLQTASSNEKDFEFVHFAAIY